MYISNKEEIRTIAFFLFFCGIIIYISILLKTRDDEIERIQTIVNKTHFDKMQENRNLIYQLKQEIDIQNKCLNKVVKDITYDDDCYMLYNNFFHYRKGLRDGTKD